MRTRQRTWAVVLAAGDGTRLSALTRDARGNPVPKQFCSLDGGGSLLHEAIQRARAVAPRDRICVIVSESHREYWQRALWSVPASNIIVQPGNRGTAHGILLATLAVMQRDPLARIAFLPADHHVRDEVALARALRRTVTLLTRDPVGLMLLGIEPDEADPELGYILPGPQREDGSVGVERFVEKPPVEEARALLSRGALWNSFIFAVQAPALLGLLRERLGTTVDAIASALARDFVTDGRAGAVQAAYARLDSIDFSRAIVQGAEHRLRVIAAPACGWTDLGTPKRVADTLRRPRVLPTASPRRPWHVPAFLSLAAQQARLQMPA